MDLGDTLLIPELHLMLILPRMFKVNVTWRTGTPGRAVQGTLLKLCLLKLVYSGSTKMVWWDSPSFPLNDFPIECAYFACVCSCLFIYIVSLAVRLGSERQAGFFPPCLLLASNKSSVCQLELSATPRTPLLSVGLLAQL